MSLYWSKEFLSIEWHFLTTIGLAPWDAGHNLLIKTRPIQIFSHRYPFIIIYNINELDENIHIKCILLLRSLDMH